MKLRTVEKIGGTSMSRFPELIDNLFLVNGQPRYDRLFVVSAFGGMTDLLLEHKHSGEPGVFGLFSEGEDAGEWPDRLADVGTKMKEINAGFFEDLSLRQRADEFVEDRVEDARQCLTDVQRICSFGSFELDAYLDRVRELLSSMGEAHSAFNAAMLLRASGVNARFVDLTGWRDDRMLSLSERLEQGLSGLDLETELPIVTGYAQCREGLVKRYARGYTEIVMSHIAARLSPEEAVIHKEYHLSSADPRIVGVQHSSPIGRTNYDVADQLANLGMEAIHPNAASVLRKQGIPLRVKHAFEPDHAGTLIDSEYCSDEPRVEIVAGRRGLMAIEVFDQEMAGELMARERSIIDVLDRFRVRSIGKDVNANSVTHFVSSNLRTVRRLTEELARQFPGAAVETKKVAFVCAVGSDLDLPGLLARCATALGDAGIAILSASQPLRGVDVRFVVVEEDYEKAVRALHDTIIRDRSPITAAA